MIVTIPPRPWDLSPLGYELWLDGFVVDFQIGVINALYRGPDAWISFWSGGIDDVEAVGLAVLFQRGGLGHFIKGLMARKGSLENARIVTEDGGANQNRGRHVNNGCQDQRKHGPYRH